jgi:branched-chain amino acid transport system ATP-binding protein
MAEPTLSVERLSLAFGGLRVLEGVSFSVHPGELLALIGPNGAGKTSILNCIGGIYRPSGGRIVFEGREVTGTRPHAMARLGLARTFQHGELFGHMTVLENLLVARHARIATSLLGEGFRSRHTRRAEVEHRCVVEEILAFVELTRYRHQPVSALPFGIQKVIGFARALALEPRVLLLDEPSAGASLDDVRRLDTLLSRLRDSGVAILLVEHNLRLVRSVADRVIVMAAGAVIATGTPAVVAADPDVRTAYLGRAAL